MSARGFDGQVTVKKVISQRAGGAIFTSISATGEEVRVKYQGHGAIPLPGDAYHVSGTWTQYADKFNRVTPQVSTGMMKRVVAVGELLTPWLQRLPNIGPERAKRLTDWFGHNLVNVLKDPLRMAEVASTIEPSKPALASRIAAQVYAAMSAKSVSDQTKLAEVTFLVKLEDVGLREPYIANRLWRLMSGKDAMERLLRNPYVPAHLIDWRVADRIGKRLLREVSADKNLDAHPARLSGGLTSVWRELIADGDSAASEGRVREMLRGRKVDPDLALEHARQRRQLHETADLLRAPGAAWIEGQVTSMLAKVESTPPSISIPHGDVLDTIIEDAESATFLGLTDEQRNAIHKLLPLPFGVLQGGAGVGKTTVMKVLVHVWERIGGNIVMGALAGKAALQLSRGASSHDAPRLAHTLSRLIMMLEDQGQQQSTMGFGRQSEVLFDDKTLLVIDEAGMLDTPTLHQILKLLPVGVRLLLVGDDGQLFPIGFGKVFHDLVADGSRVARLTKILRQSGDSDIPVVASQIRSGTTPTLKKWNGEAKGVFMMPFAESHTVRRKLQGDDFLLVAALRRTVDGINASETIAGRCSTIPVRRLGPLAEVAVADPVVITKNRYQHGLFNGLLGRVTEISGERVLIHFDGEREPRELPEEAEADVELAYAITCHKAQGSSADKVMVMVEKSPLVTREWLYTAVTRAKILVLLVVVEEVDIGEAIARRTTRTTGMRIKPLGHC